MANADMKIFEAEKLHQPIIVAVSIIPIIPCNENTTPKLERMIIGRRQYPNTLATQPKDTPVILMRLRRQYMARQPIALMPYT